jgi:hypothetical protein
MILLSRVSLGWMATLTNSGQLKRHGAKLKVIRIEQLTGKEPGDAGLILFKTQMN